jgi:hypothetical protein
MAAGPQQLRAADDVRARIAVGPKRNYFIKVAERLANSSTQLGKIPR